MNSDAILKLKDKKEKIMTRRIIEYRLVKSSRIIKKAISISKKFKRDFSVLGEGEYPYNIGEVELLARYTFFGTVIGIIDEKISCTRRLLKENYDEYINYFAILNLIKDKIISDSKNLKINFKQIDQLDDSDIYSNILLNLLTDDGYRYKDQLLKIYKSARNKASKVKISDVCNLYNYLYDNIYAESLKNYNKHIGGVMRKI